MRQPCTLIRLMSHGRNDLNLGTISDPVCSDKVITKRRPCRQIAFPHTRSQRPAARRLADRACVRVRYGLTPVSD
jgi:hypothetical protein